MHDDPRTDLPLFEALLADDRFVSGDYDTGLLGALGRAEPTSIGRFMATTVTAEMVDTVQEAQVLLVIGEP